MLWLISGIVVVPIAAGQSLNAVLCPLGKHVGSMPGDHLPPCAWCQWRPNHQPPNVNLQIETISTESTRSASSSTHGARWEGTAMDKRADETSWPAGRTWP